MTIIIYVSVYILLDAYTRQPDTRILCINHTNRLMNRISVKGEGEELSSVGPWLKEHSSIVGLDVPHPIRSGDGEVVLEAGHQHNPSLHHLVEGEQHNVVAVAVVQEALIVLVDAKPSRLLHHLVMRGVWNIQLASYPPTPGQFGTLRGDEEEGGDKEEGDSNAISGLGEDGHGGLLGTS